MTAAPKPKCRRGTSNKNVSGNAAQRRARKRSLLFKHGDGTTCPCYRCGTELTFVTLTVDRIIPGMDGGTYARGNCRPACEPCNIETGNRHRDHRRRFPLGWPVRFARHGAPLYDVVGGEGEAALTLRSRFSGNTYTNIDRARLVAVEPAQEQEQAA